MGTEGETANRAPQVCLHCKSIKKGCDKKLPSCSQCIKRRVVCRYGEPEHRRSRDGTPNSDSSAGRNERFGSPWSSIPRSLRAKLSPSLRLSLLFVNSLSEVFPPEFSADPKSQQFPTTIDSIVHSQVCHIFRADGKYVDAVATRYFQGVHTWLPIVARRRFLERLAHFQHISSADFSILLLAIGLITQHPSLDPSTNQDREVFYLATKTMFAKVQAFIPSSLCLVQAGVILSFYEYAHGMIEAAYVTIGTCARMAAAIGLNNKQCSVEMQASEAWVDDEEALCTWWGLVICDRVVSLDPAMHGRPLATRSIREDDYLPLEAEDFESGLVSSLEPTFRYFVSATSLPGVGSFGREAQATYLLDKVRIAIESGETSHNTMYPIGRELQSLLGTVMDQVAGKTKDFCGAIQMLITSLYTLHQASFMRSDLGPRPDSKEHISATLNTLTRMVIDISYGFNLHPINVEVLAPACRHVVRCAQQHIATSNDFNNPQWQEDLHQLKLTLGYFNRRWGIGEKELVLIDQTLEMSMAMQI